MFEEFIEPEFTARCIRISAQKPRGTVKFIARRVIITSQKLRHTVMDDAVGDGKYYSKVFEEFIEPHFAAQCVRISAQKPRGRVKFTARCIINYVQKPRNTVMHDAVRDGKYYCMKFSHLSCIWCGRVEPDGRPQSGDVAW